MRILPPPNDFEVASRRSRFSKARRGAARTSRGRQAWQLEEYIGRVLFHSLLQSLHLMSRRRDMALSVKAALEQIRKALEAIRVKRGKHIITVDTLASISALRTR